MPTRRARLHAGHALDAVVVSATRTEQAFKSLPTHVVVLDATRIAESPAQAVPELLRSFPDSRRAISSRRSSRPEPVDRVLPRARWLVRRPRTRAARRHSGGRSVLRLARLGTHPAPAAAVGRSGARRQLDRVGEPLARRRRQPSHDRSAARRCAAHARGGSLGTYHGTGVASISAARRPSRSAATSGTPTASCILRAGSGGSDRSAARRRPTARSPER